MRVFRCEIVADFSVVLPQCLGIVVPVHRHSQCITNEQSIQGACYPICAGNLSIHAKTIDRPE